MHSILLKSQQFYKTQAPTCFGSYWPIIRGHTIIQNSCLTFYACSKAAKKTPKCDIYVVDRVVR